MTRYKEMKEKDKIKNQIFQLIDSSNEICFNIQKNLFNFGSIIRLTKKNDKLYFVTTSGISICYNLSDITPFFLNYIYDKIKSGEQDIIRYKEIEFEFDEKQIKKEKVVEEEKIVLKQNCVRRGCNCDTFSITKSGESLCEEHFFKKMYKTFIRKRHTLKKIESRNDLLGKIYRDINGKRYLISECFVAEFEEKHKLCLVLFLNRHGYKFNVNEMRIVK